jgi:hypothetical protein
MPGDQEAPSATAEQRRPLRNTRRPAPGIIRNPELWRKFRDRKYRHTFVVRRIAQWQAQGVDVDQAMLALSTYVGHAEVGNTYWYLSAAPELMTVAADRFASFVAETEARNA